MANSSLLNHYYKKKNMYVGTIHVPDGIIDITDPSYDKNISEDCAIRNKKVKPGDYKCYVNVVDYPYEDKVGNIRHSYALMRLTIIHKKPPDYIYNILNFAEWKHIGKVAVDAGMCGFYNHKPDFDREEQWTKFWQSLSKLKGFPLIDCDCQQLNGITVNSGFGDGYYGVSQFEDNGEVYGLSISFNG